MKYRKKPVTIDAYQTDVELDIPTLEGTMHASVGDYIITGVRGERYPCKPDIFIETYEPAEDEQRNAELDLQIKDNWKLTAELMVSQQKNEDLRKLVAAVKEVFADMDCDNCPMLRHCDDNNMVCCDKPSFHAVEELRELVMHA